MAANFKKNEKQLLAAYNDVLNDKTDTDWAIFGYEGKSNDLKVVETGDGGIEELVDEMNSGKVLYAFLRVTDPNTKLPKNVLVNWSGEGVPSSLRGVYARHTTDVARFFRGAHVTINARSEMDLEEDTILEKVSKASGANFGFHKEKAKPIPEQGPVGSVYKKANPQAEINVKSRDQFWSDQERAEGQRVATEKRQAAEARRREELDRREREAREGATRDQAAKERFRAIDEQKHREQERQKQERDAKEAELQTRLKRREDEVEGERRRESDALRRRRVEEHTSISAAVQQKKAGFEQPPAEQPPLPTRPPKRVPPTPVSRPPPEPETQQEYPPEPEEEYPPEPEETYPPEPEETYPPEPEETYPPEPEETYPPKPEETYPPEPEEEYPPEPEQPMYDDVQQSLPQEELAPEEPEQPLYDDVQEAREPPPAEPYYESTSGYDPQVDEPEPDQPMYDDVQEVAGGRGGGEEGGGPAEEGLKARTVYDYEATDDTEISFDVDEIITDIEQIDEGWWRGVRELDGSYGLFPANYVELI